MVEAIDHGRRVIERPGAWVIQYAVNIDKEDNGQRGSHRSSDQARVGSEAFGGVAIQTLATAAIRSALPRSRVDSVALTRVASSSICPAQP